MTFILLILSDQYSAYYHKGLWKPANTLFLNFWEAGNRSTNTIVPLHSDTYGPQVKPDVWFAYRSRLWQVSGNYSLLYFFLSIHLIIFKHTVLPWRERMVIEMDRSGDNKNWSFDHEAWCNYKLHNRLESLLPAVTLLALVQCSCSCFQVYVGIHVCCVLVKNSKLLDIIYRPALDVNDPAHSN